MTRAERYAKHIATLPTVADCHAVARRALADSKLTPAERETAESLAFARAVHVMHAAAARAAALRAAQMATAEHPSFLHD